MLNLVYVIDTSLSMKRGVSDLVPTKLEAVKETLTIVTSKILSNNEKIKIGGVVFYGYAYPILPLTNDNIKIIKTLSRLRILGEGSAPGDGLIEAVKLMRRSAGEKKAIIITDGGFNKGIPLNIAALYAWNSRVIVDIVAISGRLKDVDHYYMDKTTRMCSGKKVLVNKKSELIKTLLELSSHLGNP